MLWSGITREGNGSPGAVTLAAMYRVCSYGNRNEIIPHRFPDLRGRSSDYDLHLRGYVAVGRYGHTQFPQRQTIWLTTYGAW